MLILIAVFSLFWSSFSWALPIGFGHNQGDIVYSELHDENFTVYHDSRAPEEGHMALKSLRAARPVLQQWLGIERLSPLPVIISSVSSQASFYNFVTDAIELQTLGYGDRDLYWHEYVHQFMFLHLRNPLGPAGSILHIPWMPAWFIEGLAEALSSSIGSHQQAGIERYQAQSDSWPSYARLHSLYGAGDFFLQGYATSGSFVSWILRQKALKPGGLPSMLSDFFWYTMPWYYPLAVSPLSPFLPMDQVLKDYYGASGLELYERYKKEAKDFWVKNKTFNFSFREAQPQRLLLSAGINPVFSGLKPSVILISSRDSSLWSRYDLEFNADSSLLKSLKERELMPASPDKLRPLFYLPPFSVGLHRTMESRTGFDKQEIIFWDSSREGSLSSDKEGMGLKSIRLPRSGSVLRVFPAEKKVYWLEKNFGKNKICFVERTELLQDFEEGQAFLNESRVSCPVVTELPLSLDILGEKKRPAMGYGDDFVEELILGFKEQNLSGLSTKVQILNLDSGLLRDFTGSGEEYLRVVYSSSSDEFWAVVAERRGTALKRMSMDGVCLSYLRFDDYILNMGAGDEGSLYLSFYAGSDKASWLRVDPAKDLPMEPCPPTPSDGHNSPLLWAMKSIFENKSSDRSGPPLELALEKSSIWQPVAAEGGSSPIPSADDPRSLSSQYREESPESRKIAKWRARPIFVFPWIGADDPLGYQFGVLSVPLMDHLQNETLQASLLLGAQSHFPDVDVSLVSTRFWPTISAAIYKKQIWNGTFYSSALRRASTSYYDEQGLRLTSRYSWSFDDSSVSVESGLTMAFKKRKLGAFRLVEGHLMEPFFSVGWSKSLSPFYLSVSLSGRATPIFLNKNFEYNQVTLESDLSRKLKFLSSNWSLNMKASRIRGKGAKTPFVREVYTPLRIFIPGGGGGINQNNYPVLGSNFLFANRHGDTQARLRGTYSFPLITNIERLFWIFYLERLSFSSFYQYGGAWNQQEKDIKRYMLSSYGHSLDLVFENKGVHFNLGLGLGRLLPHSYDMYLTAGFDALF